MYNSYRNMAYQNTNAIIRVSSRSMRRLRRLDGLITKNYTYIYMQILCVTHLYTAQSVVSTPGEGAVTQNFGTRVRPDPEKRGRSTD